MFLLLNTANAFFAAEHQIVLLQFAIKRSPVDSESSSCFDLVPTKSLQDFYDMTAFYLN
jgi:hypothetical protein